MCLFFNKTDIYTCVGWREKCTNHLKELLIRTNYIMVSVNYLDLVIHTNRVIVLYTTQKHIKKKKIFKDLTEVLASFIGISHSFSLLEN